MNIHEYQAKGLFEQYGIPTPKGIAVQSEKDFETALQQMPEGIVVVKSQIHAGGRGKGTFTNGYQGGVKIAKTHDEARNIAAKMLGNTLVTKQTGPSGKQVNTIYFNAPCSIEKEYYMAITLDRSSSKHVIIASSEGGMDIEEVAATKPEAITKVFIDPALGIQPFHCREIAFGLGFVDGAQMKQISKIVPALYKLFMDKDASLVEINPLVTDKDGNIIALDAKIGFDDNALFRHSEIQELRDLSEEDPKEVEASKYGLSYIALDGNIACLVNGAGLAMATMDIIKHFGGNPANFLDVGGSATAEQVENAFRIILSDPNVEGILVNIFGGIMSCKTIAEGVVAAAKSVEIKVPLVVRLEGNQVKEGKAILAESGLSITSGDSLADGAEKIVALVKQAKN
ncbi:MAG: ADP-forming succinate--CoA ligase subunit beta [Opitutales bacterium]|nr:ADP-forming succinate--CoA ligase subunit beta [Opitutales bacterium]